MVSCCLSNGSPFATRQKCRLSEPKTFGNDNSSTCIAQMSLIGVDEGENIVRKAESAGYQHFLLFTQCFQKASFSVSF